MSMRRRAEEPQPEMRIAKSDLRSPGHAFYDHLNAVFREAKFERLVEDRFELLHAKGHREEEGRAHAPRARA